VTVPEARMPSSSETGAARATRADPRTRAFIDALERLEHTGDVEPIVSLFDPHAEIANPADERRERHGVEGAREFWSAYRGAFEAVRSEFRNIVDGGDVAILEWTSTGRTVNGVNVAYPGTSVLEFTGDRIRRFRAYFDPADLEGRHDPHGEVGA
jgi:ketosteroid isomerase-like protein